MTGTPIRYTYHARQRMAQRQISEQMGHQTLEGPERAGEGYSGRSLAWRAFPPGVLKVVYAKKRDAIVIITTIWD